MRHIFLAVALLALSITGSSMEQSSSIDSRANAEHLKIGRFLYRTSMKEKDLGTSEITISKLGPDRFMFTNRVSGAFAQQWKALATATFVPVSAKRTFGEGDKLRPRFELNYREERAIGWRLEKSTANKFEVDVRVLPDTVDQRIDWAAAMSQVWFQDMSSHSRFLIPLLKSVM